MSFDKGTIQKFSLHGIAGLGGSTPLNPRDVLEIFQTSDAAVALYPQAKGKNYIGFVTPDRDRFYREAFGGIQIKTQYFDKDTEEPLDRFPATFSLTYGFDEAVTGGRIHGGVLRADGFYPLPSTLGSNFYFFFSALSKPSHAEESDPAPGTRAAGGRPRAVGFLRRLGQLPTINRDYYRIGIGLDFIRLIQYIQSGGHETSQTTR